MGQYSTLELLTRSILLPAGNGGLFGNGRLSVTLITSSSKALPCDRSSILHIMLPAHPLEVGFCLSILPSLEQSSRIHIGLTVAVPCLCCCSIDLFHRTSNLWKQLGQDKVIPSCEEAAQHYSRREQDLESQGHIRRKGDRINLRGGIYGDRLLLVCPQKRWAIPTWHGH
jgi:hypothetical protein